MGFGSFGDQAIPLPCPHCGDKINMPLAWFKEKDCSCPSCGAALNAKDLAKTLTEVGSAMANLNDAIRKFGGGY